MNKQEERALFRKVFGERSNQAQDSERPDFLFAHLPAGRLGVEVTSFYANNAAAKLQQLDGYSRALIDRTSKVHRADVGHLSVEDVTFLNPDGSDFSKATGILQEMPSQLERYKLLTATLNEKERKATEYLQSCDEVDLIILDGSNLFHHATHEDFHRIFHLLAPKNDLINSKFREIHLITTTNDQKSVCIPLIANTFIADCYAFEHLLKPEIASGRSTSEIFQLLAASLSCMGYSRVRAVSDVEGVGFSCGAWELLYAPDGKKLRDRTYPLEAFLGEALDAAIADFATEIMGHARELVLKRANCFSALDLRLPAHADEPTTLKKAEPDADAVITGSPHT